MTKGFAALYKESCMVALHQYSHKTGVGLAVINGKSGFNAVIQWTDTVTAQLLKAHAEPSVYVEEGACALALLLIREITPYTAVEQAIIGTTVDYYLANQPVDDTLIFNNSVRLEVSGLAKETEGNTVDGRIKQKIRRLKEAKGDKTFIVIVEFEHPSSKIVEQ